MGNIKTQTETAGRDAEILGLEADYLGLEAAMAEADEAGRDALTDSGSEIRRRIAHLRAHTPDGMAVKARLLLEAARTGGADWDEPLAKGLLADLERLQRLAG